MRDWDYLGNKLNVGDKVVYISCNIEGFNEGIITKLNPKTLIVKDTRHNTEYRREYNKVIKIS